MDDLISRQAVRFVEMDGKKEHPTFNLDDAYEQGFEDCLEKVLALPSIDAVKHGRWIKHVLKNSNIPWGYDCSVCDEYFVINEWAVERYKFCPNCGARMDEGGNHETH